MKIVVAISEEAYEYLLKEQHLPNGLDLEYFIIHGVPLPERHGRLIDYGYIVDAIDDWINTEEYRYTNATDYLRKRIANAPTIIEEEKESE